MGSWPSFEPLIKELGARDQAISATRLATLMSVVISVVARLFVAVTGR
jgi:hypothetical protein